MTDYSQGKVYMIKSLINHDCYIGSTIQTLRRRGNKHLSDANCDRRAYCESYKIVLDKHKIILLEKYPCKTKEELLKREQYWMEQFPDCINKQRAVRTKEQQKEYLKNYVIANRDIIEENRRNSRRYKSTWGYNKYLGTDLNLLDISLDVFQD
tara:strand:+ start:1901 stop:2359 length:459 start_codon:yes stop_codon:yes gene_type:complete